MSKKKCFPCCSTYLPLNYDYDLWTKPDPEILICVSASENLGQETVLFWCVSLLSVSSAISMWIHDEQGWKQVHGVLQDYKWTCFIYVCMYNLLDDTGCKTVMSWIKSAGSQHAIRTVNSGCKPKLLGGQRSKCLGFRMTPTAEHGQDLIWSLTLNYCLWISDPNIQPHILTTWRHELQDYY